MIELQDLLGDHRIDCWSLCEIVRQRAGKNWPALGDYYDQLCGDLCRGKRAALQAMTRLDGKQPYCAVALACSGKFVTHVGIVLSDCETFIHVCQTRGVVVERLDQWAAHFKGYYEYD